MSSNNGGRNRRRRARRNDVDVIRGKEIEKSEDQEYARITAALGAGRFNVQFLDGKSRICKVRGKMQRKQYVRKDDLVLVELRDYQNDKADIVHRFGPDEVKTLIKTKQVPSNFVVGTETTNDFDIQFEDDGNVCSEEENSSWEAASNLQQPNRNLDKLPEYNSDSEEEPVATVIDLDNL